MENNTRPQKNAREARDFFWIFLLQLSKEKRPKNSKDRCSILGFFSRTFWKILKDRFEELIFWEILKDHFENSNFFPQGEGGW